MSGQMGVIPRLGHFGDFKTGSFGILVSINGDHNDRSALCQYSVRGLGAISFACYITFQCSSKNYYCYNSDNFRCLKAPTNK